MTTRERVKELAASGDYKTMVAIGEEIGVTRERVRQIIRQDDLPWDDRAFEWDCPGCGKTIRVQRSILKLWKHMPAHCRHCSIKNQREFCKRGHLRAENTGSYGQCYPCVNSIQGCVMERRSCVDCGKELPITRNMMRQIKVGRLTGRRCRKCHSRYARDLSHKKPYCKWGHARTPENLYRSGACRACMRRRGREYYARERATSGGASA